MNDAVYSSQLQSLADYFEEGWNAVVAGIVERNCTNHLDFEPRTSSLSSPVETSRLGEFCYDALASRSRLYDETKKSVTHAVLVKYHFDGSMQEEQQCTSELLGWQYAIEPAHALVSTINRVCDEIDVSAWSSLADLDVLQDVQKAIELCKKCYSTLRKVRVNISMDPEIAQRRSVNFALSVTGAPEIVLKDEAIFHDHLEARVGLKAMSLISKTYEWVDG